jgi:hypothetical protein
MNIRCKTIQDDDVCACVSVRVQIIFSILALKRNGLVFLNFSCQDNKTKQNNNKKM